MTGNFLPCLACVAQEGKKVNVPPHLNMRAIDEPKRVSANTFVYRYQCSACGSIFQRRLAAGMTGFADMWKRM